MLAAALVLSACASPRRVEERVAYERRDTVQAVFGENLTVCFDDFKIIPPDTCRSRIEAARVRVERRRDAVVAAVAEEEIEKVEETRVEQPPRRALAKGWLLLLVGAVGFILGLKVRINR